MIKVDSIRKRLGGKEVLKGISLEVKEGEAFVIIGPSGCGKSVLLKHMIGLMKPDEGRIVINGLDITKASHEELLEIRKSMGVVFQGGALFDSLTVFENVAFPLRKLLKLSEEEIRQRVELALERVGLQGVENLYPEELSGGMRKRVAFARAVVAMPKVLFLDEPTTGLDPVTSATIDELIVNLKKGLSLTLVMVTHDMRSAFRVADKIAMLYEGVIVVQGDAKEIRESNNPFIRQFMEGSLEGPICVKLA
ncbi:MAG: ABC transporter ATP-binding protein [Synergistetes bacterium]|nr:MAG: Ribonucleotide ABC transporter ATP-binding protein [bacterium 42_11]MBC7332559.1 ABC transporter ATP-binding protein [Synergistota bacterium]MDK2871053.1 phospholipid/cholesterol/gamma-HCH transport system ATP-binding protein [bacterium]